MKWRWLFKFGIVNLGLLYFSLRDFSIGDSWRGLGMLGGMVTMNALLIFSYRLEKKRENTEKLSGAKASS